MEKELRSIFVVVQIEIYLDKVLKLLNFSIMKPDDQEKKRINKNIYLMDLLIFLLFILHYII